MMVRFLLLLLIPAYGQSAQKTEDLKETLMKSFDMGITVLEEHHIPMRAITQRIREVPYKEIVLRAKTYLESLLEKTKTQKEIKEEKKRNHE